MATADEGDLLYEGVLELRFSMTFQQYYCIFTDTGVFKVYQNESMATSGAAPTKQTRITGVKDWSGETMFGSHENSFKIVTFKGNEVSASARNRNECTLWVKSITAVTDPESHEGQKLQKHKRKQARAIEKEKKRQDEYEARAKAHRSLPSVPAEKPDVPPISYLTDPRRTRLDARNFPKYREHLKAQKIETRLTASLDEAKREEKKKKSKRKKKREEDDEGAIVVHEESNVPPPPPPPAMPMQQPPPPPVPGAAPPTANDVDFEICAKFNNLLKLGLSHEEVKNFMAAEGHLPEVLDRTSYYLSHPNQPLPQPQYQAPVQDPYQPPTHPPPSQPEAPLPESPKKKSRKSKPRMKSAAPAQHYPTAPPLPDAPPARKSLMEQIRAGFSFNRKKK
ncbi:hypothetical protein THRCLA_01753 [Thraustotheca clavata]|uniref:PH domain-containing protein n=1 Tax=Thraustotheca clavata TaxID=74557 RepID=A0A1W0A7L4_9STRA|nr:hypothetical protein THRCLA_01753 [Thraustotheca clavata]